MSTYKLVYPTGETVQREGDVPPIGYDVDGFRVDYVRDGDSAPVVFLGLHDGQVDVVKLVFIEVGAERCPVTLAEAAELADRARALSGGNLELPHTALAVRLEQLVEEGVEVPVMSMLGLFWTVATRRQLERWEPYVAAHIYAQFGRRHVLHDGDIWLAELEHHFALVAARNLIHALELEPASTVALDPTIRAELIEGRDLLEHWVDNLPVLT